MSHRGLPLPGRRRTLIVVLSVAGLLMAGLVAEEAWRLARRPPRSTVAESAPTPPAGRPTAGSSDGQPSSPTSTSTVPTNTRRPSPTGIPAAQPTPSPAPAGSREPFGPGAYRVGVDIAPGTWSTGGVLNLALNPCRYSINGAPPVDTSVGVGKIRVTLHAGDTFNTSGCRDWILEA